jgi:hypothetical protein
MVVILQVALDLLVITYGSRQVFETTRRAGHTHVFEKRECLKIEGKVVVLLLLIIMILLPYNILC